MQYLKIVLFSMLVMILTACNEETETAKEPEEEIVEDVAEEVEIVAPTNEEVKGVTENFVSSIFAATEEMGLSDEVPLTEDRYDELQEKLSTVVTEDFLQGGLKEVLLNMCYACDANAFPTFYYMDDTSLTYENGVLDGTQYTIEVSYFNEMLDMLEKEIMTFNYENDTWKVQTYAFGDTEDTSAVEPEQQEEQQVETSVDETEAQEEVTEDVEAMEVTPESFIGFWEPWDLNADTYYFGSVTIFPDFQTQIDVEVDHYTYSTTWEGTLSFDENNVATMEIEQDGRPGIVTLQVNDGYLDVDFTIEEGSGDAESNPWAESGHLHLWYNYNMSKDMK